MPETIVDQYGIQYCPGNKCINQQLELKGAWEYNLKIVPGKYSFHCPNCHMGYVGNIEETQLHLDGLDALEKLKEVAKHREKAGQHLQPLHTTT